MWGFGVERVGVSVPLMDVVGPIALLAMITIRYILMRGRETGPYLGTIHQICTFHPFNDFTGDPEELIRWIVYGLSLCATIATIIYHQSSSRNWYDRVDQKRLAEWIMWVYAGSSLAGICCAVRTSVQTSFLSCTAG